MKRILLCFLLFLVTVSFSSCHRRSAKEKFMAKVEKVTVNYAKEELQLDKIDSVVLIAVDTLTAYAYVDFTLPYVEEMCADFQAQYAEMLNSTSAAELTDLENKIEELVDAQNYYREVIDNESVDNKEPFRYLVRAAIFKDGPRDILNFFIDKDFQICDFEPTDYSILEK